MGLFTESPYAALDRSDLQLKYLWNILLPLPLNLPIQIPFGLSIPEPGLVSTNAVSVDFGMPESANLIEMDFGNRKNRSLGKIDVDDVTIKLLEMEYSFMMLYFRTWWSNAVSRKGIYNPQKSYKRTIIVVLLTQGLTPCMIYRLDGAFPRALPKYALDYKENDVLTIEVKLSVDMVDVFTFYPDTTSEVPAYRQAAEAALKLPSATGQSFLQTATSPLKAVSAVQAPAASAAKSVAGIEIPEVAPTIEGVKSLVGIDIPEMSTVTSPLSAAKDIIATVVKPQVNVPAIGQSSLIDAVTKISGNTMARDMIGQIPLIKMPTMGLIPGL